MFFCVIFCFCVACEPHISSGDRTNEFGPYATLNAHGREYAKIMAANFFIRAKHEKLSRENLSVFKEMKDILGKSDFIPMINILVLDVIIL